MGIIFNGVRGYFLRKVSSVMTFADFCFLFSLLGDSSLCVGGFVVDFVFFFFVTGIFFVTGVFWGFSRGGVRYSKWNSAEGSASVLMAL